MNPPKAADYVHVVQGISAHIYSYYAEKILASTTIRNGTCLDAGCGGGFLGMALAAMTDLRLVFMDQSPTMLRMVHRNIEARCLAHRSETLLAPVQAIPMADGSVDLVISRGSVPFWEDLPTTFREFRRILRPGGQGFIWGGVHTREIQKGVTNRLKQWMPDWGQHQRRLPQRNPEAIAAALWEAGFRHFEVAHDDVGTWVQFSNEYKKYEQGKECASSPTANQINID